MLNRTFFVEEYEENIPLFLINNKKGTVHSIFNNGMNIRMGERLFFIGTTKNGRLPFGIHLHNDVVHELLQSIHSPSSISWKEKTAELFFESANVHINLKSGTPYSNKINEHKNHYEPSTLYFKEMITTLVENGEKTGLDIDIEQFILEYLTDEKKELHNLTVEKIYHLMNAVFSEDVIEIDKVVRYFLGRGKGLTPSGDDHLVGLLAIHHISQAFSPAFLRTLQKIIEYESITTDIGKEYLMYALKGKFSSSIIDILNNLQEKDHQLELKKHLQQIMTMGHSSGVDTAFGLVIGLLALRKEQMPRRC